MKNRKSKKSRKSTTFPGHSQNFLRTVRVWHQLPGLVFPLQGHSFWGCYCTWASTIGVGLLFMNEHRHIMFFFCIFTCYASNRLELLIHLFMAVWVLEWYGAWYMVTCVRYVSDGWALLKLVSLQGSLEALQSQSHCFHLNVSIGVWVPR